MKAIVFAGGKATRFSELIGASNKHLVPIGNELLIHRGINNLVIAGANDILIVTNRDWEDTFAFVERDLRNCAISIASSSSPTLQLAEVLFESKSFIGNDDFLLLLGDNLFLDSPVNLIRSLIARLGENVIVLARSDTPQEFGVPFFRGQQIINIREKPPEISTFLPRLVVTGIARYTPQILELVGTKLNTNVVPRDLTALHNLLIRIGTLSYIIYNGRWFDIGNVPRYTQAISQLHTSANGVVMLPENAELKEVLRDYETVERIIELYEQETYNVKNKENQ